MAEPLEADLQLDISAALSSVDDLASGVESSLSSALATFDSEFADLASGIPPLELDADLTSATEQLDLFASAVEEPVTVPVEGDTAGATEALGSFVDEAETNPVVVPVEADTAEAQQNVDDLTSSVEEGSSANRDYSGSLSGAGAAAGIARGEIGGAAAAASSFSGTAAVGVGIVGAFAGTVGMLYEKGVEATGQLQRFNTIVGDMADEVLSVNVGSLNTDLDKLAITLGTDDEALRDSNASLFQLAKNSGAADDAAAQFANNLTGLAARAVALKPELGSVADVADSLGTRLARGGRFLINYGIALTADEIATRALANTHKESADQLTIYEKSVAAADIAIERYGGTLDRVVTEGSKNAIIQQRSLQEQFDDIFEAIGQPLVAPIFELIETSQPLVKAFGEAVGDLAIAAIPTFTAALKTASALLPVFTEAVQLIGPTMENVSQVVLLAADALDTLGINATASGAAIGFMLGGPWGALAGAAIGLASDIGLVDSGMEESTETTYNFIEGLQDLVAEFADAQSAQLRGVSTNVQAARIFDNLTSGVGYAERAFKKFHQVAEQDPVLAQRIIDGRNEEGKSTERYIAILDRANQRRVAAAQNADANRTAETLLTGSYQEQIDVLLERNDVLLASYDTGFALIHAAERERDAIDNLNTAKAEAVKSGATAAEAQEAENRALIEAEESVIATTKAVKAKSLEDYATLGPVAASEQAIKDQIGSLESLRDTLDPTSPLAIFIQGLIDKLSHEALNSVHTSKVVVEGVEIAASELAVLNEQIGKFIQAGGIGSGFVGGFAFRAAEGAVVPARPGGTLVTVGEAGATEVIVPTDDRARAAELLMQGGLGDLLSRSFPTPSGEGNYATGMEVTINVIGVSDPRQARAVGDNAAEGFRDGLAKRGIVMAARTGGG